MLPSFWGPLAHTPNSVWGTREHSYLHILRHAHSTCMHAHVQEQDSTPKPIWRKHLHFPPYMRGTFYRIMETLLPVFWLKELTTNKRDIGCPQVFVLRYNYPAKLTGEWCHTKGMRQCVLSVPWTSCAWNPLCSRLSSLNTFYPPYFLFLLKCGFSPTIQTQSKSWLNTFVDSHLSPSFWWLLEGHLSSHYLRDHIGNITDIKALEEFISLTSWLGSLGSLWLREVEGFIQGYIWHEPHLFSSFISSLLSLLTFSTLSNSL